MIAPPHYSTEDQLASTSFSSTQDPQITITPAADALHFQQGFLGIDGERPALEGEVQIKGVRGRIWDSLVLTLESRESTPTQTIQLDARTFVLFKQSHASEVPDEPQSSITFSIPLNPDTPQCIHTPHVDITHRLTAVLKPATPVDPLIQSYVVVHTRRYVARSPPPPLCTETLSISDPVVIEIQLPRRTFHSGEIIPVYITVPPVGQGFGESSGLTLRNVSSQLRRVVSASITQSTDSLSRSFPSDEGDMFQSYSGGSTSEKPYSADDAQRDDEDDESWRTPIAKTGAACRFHETRTVKLRLLLRLPSADLEPGAVSTGSGEGSTAESPDCGLITQSTLLGSTEFKLLVSASFISSRESRERVMSLSIPITILPPQAPASDIDPSLDAAYRKKHDRPPLRTTRHPQAESSFTPDEGEAGPSGQAPPPFEDADIPPPFSSAESHLNAHPPTFVESQADLTDFQVYNDQMLHSQQQSTVQYAPEGEGVLFGFPASEEFDGTQNPGVTPTPFQIGSNAQSPRSTQTLTPHLRVSRNPDTEELSTHGSLPPGIDDPSDPPPAIDVAYIAPPSGERTMQLDPPPPPHSVEDPHPIRTSPPPVGPRHATNAAPPPYLNPPTDSEPRNSVIRPPPYVESDQNIEH